MLVVVMVAVLLMMMIVMPTHGDADDHQEDCGQKNVAIF